MAIGFIALGLYLLVPGRNTFGNPAYEQELQRCTISETGEIVRLYEGNGGATTAFWYTVTHQGGWLSPERQIFYTYSVPEIRRVDCQKDAVEISFWDGFEETRESLPGAEIRRKLRSNPLGVSMGQPIQGSGSLLRMMSTIFGSVSTMIGLFVMWLAVRRSRRLDIRD